MFGKRYVQFVVNGLNILESLVQPAWSPPAECREGLNLAVVEVSVPIKHMCQ